MKHVLLVQRCEFTGWK